jgi:hypothetical protein
MHIRSYPLLQAYLAGLHRHPSYLMHASSYGIVLPTIEPSSFLGLDDSGGGGGRMEGLAAVLENLVLAKVLVKATE